MSARAEGDGGRFASGVRVEAFSDAVFAFAATLLVVALEVPDTVAELREVLRGFVPFTLSFGALVAIWSIHRAYFRRFPNVDRLAVALNSCLLFVVLFYVYPLKFLAKGIAATLLGTGESGVGVQSFDELALLFVWYGAGFAAIFLFVAALYRHGARSAEALGLDAKERHEARFLARHYALFVLVGVVSAALAATGVGVRIGLPGWIYASLGPLCGGHGWWSARGTRSPG